MRDGAGGRYAVDSFAPGWQGAGDLQAIGGSRGQEGTTNPDVALWAITSGQLDRRTGACRSPTGQALHYRATDNLTDPRLRGLLPADLTDIVAEAHLPSDPAHPPGSVVHTLGCLPKFAQLRMTHSRPLPPPACLV